MRVNINENKIFVANKEFTIDNIVKKLIKLSGEQVGSFFAHRELKLPRHFRMEALRSVLNERVKDSKQVALSDEQRYRLLNYPMFSEYQLEVYFDLLITENLTKEYKENLWKIILSSHDKIELTDSEINYLLLLEPKNDVSFKEFETDLLKGTIDSKDEYDGLPRNIFKISLRKGATLKDLVLLGKKYGFVVPKRLKKKELLDVIFHELKKRDELTPELELKLKKKSTVLISRYAKQHDIAASTELSKRDVIEYILRKLASMKDIRTPYPTPTPNLLPGMADFIFNPADVSNIDEKFGTHYYDEEEEDDDFDSFFPFDEEFNNPNEDLEEAIPLEENPKPATPEVVENLDDKEAYVAPMEALDNSSNSKNEDKQKVVPLLVPIPVPIHDTEKNNDEDEPVKNVKNVKNVENVVEREVTSNDSPKIIYVQKSTSTKNLDNEDIPTERVILVERHIARTPASEVVAANEFSDDEVVSKTNIEQWTESKKVVKEKQKEEIYLDTSEDEQPEPEEIEFTPIKEEVEETSQEAPEELPVEPSFIEESELSDEHLSEDEKVLLNQLRRERDELLRQNEELSNNFHTLSTELNSLQSENEILSDQIEQQQDELMSDQERFEVYKEQMRKKYDEERARKILEEQAKIEREQEENEKRLQIEAEQEARLKEESINKDIAEVLDSKEEELLDKKDDSTSLVEEEIKTNEEHKAEPLNYEKPILIIEEEPVIEEDTVIEDNTTLLDIEQDANKEDSTCNEFDKPFFDKEELNKVEKVLEEDKSTEELNDKHTIFSSPLEDSNESEFVTVKDFSRLNKEIIPEESKDLVVAKKVKPIFEETEENFLDAVKLEEIEKVVKKEIFVDRHEEEFKDNLSYAPEVPDLNPRYNESIAKKFNEVVHNLTEKEYMQLRESNPSEKACRFPYWVQPESPEEIELDTENANSCSLSDEETNLNVLRMENNSAPVLLLADNDSVNNELTSKEQDAVNPLLVQSDNQTDENELVETSNKLDSTDKELVSNEEAKETVNEDTLETEIVPVLSNSELKKLNKERMKLLLEAETEKELDEKLVLPFEGKFSKKDDKKIDELRDELIKSDKEAIKEAKLEKVRAKERYEKIDKLLDIMIKKEHHIKADGTIRKTFLGKIFLIVKILLLIGVVAILALIIFSAITSYQGYGINYFNNDFFKTLFSDKDIFWVWGIKLADYIKNILK